MNVDDIIEEDAHTAPRTPPRGGAGGADDFNDQRDGDDDDPDSEDDEEEEEGDGKRKRKFVSRGRRQWQQLALWDRTSKLDSEINTELLTIATAKMEESGLVEWPQVRRRTVQKTIGLWAQHGEYTREGGRVTIETYHCPLKDRCSCPVQIRVTRSTTAIILEYSGGEHTQALCHSTDTSRFLTVKQRVAVAKVVKTNPSATGTDVRMVLQQLSPTRRCSTPATTQRL